MIALPRPCIAAVTDRRRLAPDARTDAEQVRRLLAFVEDVVDAGVDLLQIREGDLEDARLLAVVAHAVRAAHGTAARVIVNARMDVALEAGAAGVHCKAAGGSWRQARAIEPAWIIGRAIHGMADVVDPDAADYWCFGTVFPSRSKPGQAASGLERLQAVAAGVTAPVLAIGGVTVGTARSCAEAGASGLAAIGVFLPAGTEPDALGPAEAVAAFRAAFLR